MCKVFSPEGRGQKKENKTEPVLSDHLGQPTHARQWWSVLFRSIMKSGDGRTDTKCEYSDHYRPGAGRPRWSKTASRLLLSKKYQLFGNFLGALHFPSVHMYGVNPVWGHYPNCWTPCNNIVYGKDQIEKSWKTWRRETWKVLSLEICWLHFP